MKSVILAMRPKIEVRLGGQSFLLSEGTRGILSKKVRVAFFAIFLKNATLARQNERCQNFLAAKVKSLNIRV